MRGQLSLWAPSKIDLMAKINAEIAAGIGVLYHFLGKPLPMYPPAPREKT